MNTFEGTISCKAIIEEHKRNIDCLYVDKKKRTKDFAYIIAIAKKQDIRVEIVEREKLNSISNSNKNGGMVLVADSLPKKKLDKKINGFIAYVDGIEDPYNLGSICRTLYASGCACLILPDRDWSWAEGTILKASAGAFEKMEIYWIKQEQELIDYLEKNEISLLCAHRKEAISLYEYKFPDNFCIAIGGSFRGLSSLVCEHSTQNIVIEYGREFRNALDAPSAVSVIAFEALRQIKSRKDGK